MDHTFIQLKINKFEQNSWYWNICTKPIIINEKLVKFVTKRHYKTYKSNEPHIEIAKIILIPNL